VQRTAENPEGIELEVNGVFYPVPIGALHKEKDKMPADLLQWEAHVCSSNPPNVKIECGWVKLIG
jgi:hypothetical protein